MADTRFKWNTIFVIDAIAIQKWRRFWTNRNKNNQQYFEMAFNTQYVNVYIERLLTKKRSPTNVLLSDNDCKPLKWKWDRCMTNANNCVECKKKNTTTTSIPNIKTIPTTNQQMKRKEPTGPECMPMQSEWS